MIEDPGTIFTFYSYKGGTGRSLAVANVAWILADNGHRVLVIDWDLEAPGLHRYFHPFLIDSELSDTPGLIDYFWMYGLRLMTPLEEDDSESSWHEDVSDLADYAIRLDWKFDRGGHLDFIPAGRQNDDYAQRINSFDWNNFYSRLNGGALLEKIREQLKRDYDYVIIDSRTGVSDTAGICTVAMPDRLVAMFTLNTQSSEGVAAVLRSVEEARSDDLEIYPVITRIELAEQDRLVAARRRARDLYRGFVASKEGGAREYWKDAEILYQPYYAYEEVLATFADETGRDFSESSLVAAMLRLARRVTGNASLEPPQIDPEKREKVLLRFTRGIGAKKEETKDVSDSVGDRMERADRYFQQTSPTAIEKADAQGRRARIERFASSILTILSGAVGVFYGRGLATDYWLIGGGAAMVAFQAFELMSLKPRLVPEWKNEETLNLWLGGRMPRQMVTAYCALAAMVVGGRSLYHWNAMGPALMWIPLFASFVALLAIASTEVMSSFETWIVSIWRRDALQQERRTYINGVTPYEVEPSQAYRLFVQRAEEIITVAPRSRTRSEIPEDQEGVTS